MNAKDVAQPVNVVILFKSLDYLESFSLSDINRAEAFFKMSLSSFKRFNSFSNSRIRTCSGVMGADFGNYLDALGAAASRTDLP